MYTHNNDWTQEEILIAESLWETTTKSAREISEIIGRSRAGVIGRARRGGWVKMLKPKESPKEKPNKPKKEKPVVVFVKKEVKKPELVKHVKGFDLKEHHCRFVIGDPKNNIYCGSRKNRGSYCKQHALVCFTPYTMKPNKMRSFV